MPPKRLRSAVAVLLLALPATLVLGQTHEPDRITAQPDLGPLTRLSHHLPTWATPANEVGPVPSDTPLDLSFVLSRSPHSQARFEQLLRDQQNPASPRFHQWLTPDQIGAAYGPTPRDLAALTAWLAAQGLKLSSVAPSRIFVNVTGTSGSIDAALQTHSRLFLNQGSTLRSASTEPVLPAALAAIVDSISGLTEAPLFSMHRAETINIPRPAPASTTPAAQADPQFTSQSSGRHFLTPGDFAVLYNLTPVYSSGINGAGQRVAIIGRSQVAPGDITAWETRLGLPLIQPNVVIPPAGIDPGITANGDQYEATLDVNRVIGTAPGAVADLVVSLSTNGVDGIRIASQHQVQTLLDPIMTISFGNCETRASLAGIHYWDTLFAQAAAEGISVFVSSGDSAATGCASAGSIAVDGAVLSPNYLCASSYATCVGGTELIDTLNPAQFWNPTNAAGLTSVLSYIPEGVWNDPITVNPATGNTSYRVLGGGGGVSSFIAKPSWQTGKGVPADGFRDTPDLSFSSSGHDGYYSCVAPFSNCVDNFTAFAGTSASAPGMAGIAALLNQKLGSHHGNLNPLLYALAALPANHVFHDATVETSGVAPCDLAVPSLCNSSTPGPASLTGGVPGYALTPGFDLATGWGSLDVANFLHAATSIGVNFRATASTTSLSSDKTFTMTASLSSLSADIPSGTVQFLASGTPLGNPIALASGAATSPALSLLPGTYSLSATYSGDSEFLPATVTISDLTVSVPGSMTLSAATPTLSLSPASSVSATDLITAQASGGFAASIQLSCVVTFNGAGPATDAPRCSFNPVSSLVLATNGSVSTNLVLSAIAPHAIPTTTATNSPRTLVPLGGVTFCALIFAILPLGRRKLGRRKLGRCKLGRRKLGRRKSKALLLSARLFAGILLLASSSLTLSGCSGSSTSTPNPIPPLTGGSTHGSYTVTVTSDTAPGQPGNVQSSTVVALTIS